MFHASSPLSECLCTLLLSYTIQYLFRTLLLSSMPTLRRVCVCTSALEYANTKSKFVCSHLVETLSHPISLYFFVFLHFSSYLLASPRTQAAPSYLLVSPRISSYLFVSPCTSSHYPISPRISCLKRFLGSSKGCRLCIGPRPFTRGSSNSWHFFISLRNSSYLFANSDNS